MKERRWYSHAMFKRYGWKVFYVNSPRVWTWGINVAVFVTGSFGLGAIVFRDQEDDEWVLLVTLIAAEFRFTRVRYWTRREQRRRHEAFVQARTVELVDEVEDFLR